MKLTLLCVPLTLRADVTGAARLARAHAERPSQPARPPLQGAEGARHGACAGFSRLLPTPRPPCGAERCPRARPRCRRGAGPGAGAGGAGPCGFVATTSCCRCFLIAFCPAVTRAKFRLQRSLLKLEIFVVIQAKVFLWAVATLKLAPKTKAPRGCAASACNDDRWNTAC